MCVFIEPKLCLIAVYHSAKKWTDLSDLKSSDFWEKRPQHKRWSLVGGWPFFKSQNLIVVVAKNATHVEFYSSFVEFLDHLASQISKKVGNLTSDSGLVFSSTYCIYQRILTVNVFDVIVETYGDSMLVLLLDIRFSGRLND